MHIPENYLSPSTCATMFAVMAPVWYVSAKKVKVQIEKKKEKVFNSIIEYRKNCIKTKSFVL